MGNGRPSGVSALEQKIVTEGLAVIEIWSSDDDSSASDSVICYGRTGRLGKPVYKDLDCFILDFNPFDDVDPSKNGSLVDGEDDQDLSVVAERGQVACRDYPHSRNLCVKYPFGKTPHGSFCGQCYCYVCETRAPCEYWKETQGGHCSASGNGEKWKRQRIFARLDSHKK